VRPRAGGSQRTAGETSPPTPPRGATGDTLAPDVATGRRSLLVANPTAKSGKAKRYIQAAMEALAESRLEPEFFPTLPQGATVGALAERLEREDCGRVIYMGGDGTFAEAAKGIILARERSGVDVPLGMLPMGTANDQGRSFGIVAGVKALPRNVDVIAAGVEQWLDVGRIEALDEGGEPVATDLWFDSCGVGLSARILFTRNRDREFVERVPLVRRVYRDKLVYTSAALRNLLSGLVLGTSFAVELTIDGETSELSGVTDLLVQGTILYAGDWIFDATAKPDDGKFEVVVLRGHADWAAAAIGGHKRNPLTGDDLEVLGMARREVPKAKHIELRIWKPAGLDIVPAQIDGEEWVSTTHYRIENLFHHLRIIVPEDPHWV
jgi:diacylglycerol kinase family enzyme